MRDHIDLSGWTEYGWVNRCSCGWYDAKRASCWGEHVNLVAPLTPPTHPNPEPPTGDGGREGVGR